MTLMTQAPPRVSKTARHAEAIPAELLRTVGARLRAIRKAQKIRLLELTKACGVDAATICRIETGQMTGTLESHMKLARGLGVKLTALYEGLEEAHAKRGVALQQPSGRTEVYVHQAGKSSMSMLTTEILKKKLMPVLITIEPGGSTNKEEAKVGTEKFLYVLEGELEAKVGETTHQLKRGSSLYFEASIPHVLKNAGSRTVRCLSVVTPPVL